MHIHAYQNRGCTYDVTFYDDNNVAITPDSGDVITARILRLGETPNLTVASDAPTANGSTFTKGSPTNSLRIDNQDLSFEPGVYTISFELTDAEDADDVKNAQRGVFTLEET